MPPNVKLLAMGEVQRFREFLLAHNLKLTKERESLLKAIFSAHYHFEADELCFRLKTQGIKTSRATVYRTLDLLVKSGLVRRVHLGEDHYHYERVTGDSHHDHLICTACGSVVEFNDPMLEERQNEICRRKKFTPTFHNLQILGICGSCQRSGARPDSPDRVSAIQDAAMILRR